MRTCRNDFYILTHWNFEHEKGTICIDIDECAFGGHKCVLNNHCENTEGIVSQRAVSQEKRWALLAS